MEGIKFNLKVMSREGVLYEGEVSSITSYNEKGVFDVLAQHANFISLITRGLTISEAESNLKDIKFDNALMKVYKNNVEVYVGIEGMSPANLKPQNYNVENKIGISS